MIIMSGRQSYSTERNDNKHAYKSKIALLIYYLFSIFPRNISQSNNHKHLCNFMSLIKLS